MVIFLRIQNIQFTYIQVTQKSTTLSKAVLFQDLMTTTLEYTKLPIPNDCIYA